MAECLDDGEFWLPSQFLTEEDGNDDGIRFPSEFPYEFDSPHSPLLSSPVESVVGSTETESDEEYISDLALKIKQSTVIGRDNELSTKPKECDFSGSPQSTLFSTEKTAGHSHDVSGISSGPLSSRPLMNSNGISCWDLPAEQVLRFNMYNEMPRFSSIPSLYPNRLLTKQQQIQVEHFYQLKQEQIMRMHLQSRHQSRIFSNEKTRGFYPPPLSQPSSGFRAVFLGGPGVQKESNGTGVFLPRGTVNATETKRKSACSTVLVPAKVVQALNLSLDEMGRPRRPNRFHHVQDRNRAPVKRGHGFQKPSAINPEKRLPPPWTY